MTAGLIKKLLVTALSTIAFTSLVSAELVENGDFSNDTAYWQIDVAAQMYGNPEPEFRLNEGALEGSHLHSTVAGYLVFRQAVEIKKDTRYKLSFESKITGRGTFNAAIYHAAKSVHVHSAVEPGPSFATTEVEFAGKFDTDSRWVDKWRKETRKNKVEAWRSGNLKLHEFLLDSKDKEEDPPSQSVLVFSLGELSGTFSIRNISIVEIQE